MTRLKQSMMVKQIRKTDGGDDEESDTPAAEVNMMPASAIDFVRFQYNTSTSKQSFFYTVLLVGWNKTLIWLSCRRPTVRDAGLAKRKNSDDPILVNP